MENGYGSVSYTHLDVYKRQEEDGTVSVRSRFAGDEGVKALDEFIDCICKEIRTK